jgi:hypothetical protein
MLDYITNFTIAHVRDNSSCRYNSHDPETSAAWVRMISGTTYVNNGSAGRVRIPFTQVSPLALSLPPVTVHCTLLCEVEN